MPALNILHVFRAPVGGLFRHVADLAREQAARGHRVGLICDAGTGGERADSILRELEPKLALGLMRIPMGRQPGPGDLLALGRVSRRVARTAADVLHGHGAKGGLYARLAYAAKRLIRVYTPHGGSLLFGHDTLAGRIYLTTERLLMPRTDLFLFESAFSAETFRRKVGDPAARMRIVHNGVTRAEFEPVAAKREATDVVFVGEQRLLKGIDVLIDAVGRMRREGRPVTATLIGDGPDSALFRAQAEKLGLAGAVRFLPAMPAREGQSMGRVMIVPSRAESLPYIVLEAAASAKPLIVTNVGGIGEIYGPLSDNLIPPDDAIALSAAIARNIDDPSSAASLAKKLKERVLALFSADAMVDGVLAGYLGALSATHPARR